MKGQTSKCLLALGVFLLWGTLKGQNNQDLTTYYEWFDSKINRTNTGLYNGLEYVELYRTINERHKFFNSSDFQVGTLVYDEEFYPNVELKYDLFDDQLLFNAGYNFSVPTIVLFKDKVQRFTLGSQQFLQVNSGSTTDEFKGYFEVLMEKSGILLLKKNKKKRFKRIRGKTIYYEFEAEAYYVMHYKDAYYRIDSKKDIANVFPDHKDYINENFNSALRKNSSDQFWTNFLSNLADKLGSQKADTSL